MRGTRTRKPWSLWLLLLCAGRFAKPSNSFKTPAPTAAAIIFPCRPATSPRRTCLPPTSSSYMTDMTPMHKIDSCSVPVNSDTIFAMIYMAVRQITIYAVGVFFCKTELRSGFHVFWSTLACSQVHWPLLCFETFFDGKTCFCLHCW